jgi:hypothetical protein
MCDDYTQFDSSCTSAWCHATYALNAVCTICCAWLLRACDAMSALSLVVAQAGALVQQVVYSASVVTDAVACQLYSTTWCTCVLLDIYIVRYYARSGKLLHVYHQRGAASSIQHTVLCSVCPRSHFGASQQSSFLSRACTCSAAYHCTLHSYYVLLCMICLCSPTYYRTVHTVTNVGAAACEIMNTTVLRRA